MWFFADEWPIMRFRKRSGCFKVPGIVDDAALKPDTMRSTSRETNVQWDYDPIGAMKISFTISFRLGVFPVLYQYRAQRICVGLERRFVDKVSNTSSRWSEHVGGQEVGLSL